MTYTRWVVLALALAGCAGLAQNTPQQNYLYALGRQCESRGISITRVAPDGRSYELAGHGGAYTIPEFEECMAAAQRAHPFVEAEWR